MGKRRKAKPVAQAATVSQETAWAVVESTGVEGEIRLLVPRLNAHKVMCPAGTVIAPDIDGWPEARVSLHLRHGHAEVVQASEEQDASGSQAPATTPVPTPPAE